MYKKWTARSGVSNSVLASMSRLLQRGSKRCLLFEPATPKRSTHVVYKKTNSSKRLSSVLEEGIFAASAIAAYARCSAHGLRNEPTLDQSRWRGGGIGPKNSETDGIPIFCVSRFHTFLRQQQGGRCTASAPPRDLWEDGKISTGTIFDFECWRPGPANPEDDRSFSPGRRTKRWAHATDPRSSVCIVEECAGQKRLKGGGQDVQRYFMCIVKERQRSPHSW